MSSYVDHSNRHGARGTDAPPPGDWYYATPISPATTPDDYVSGADGNAPFENGWLNVALPDTTYSPLRWRFVTKGRVEIVGAVDGGPEGSVVVTLPEVFRPETDTTVVVASTDGSQVMTLAISASTGAVVMVTHPTLDEGEVTTTKIADGSVTTAKLANEAVTTAKLADDAVTAAKIATGAVGSSELASSGVSAATYGDATHVGQFTVDADGRITSASSVAITGSSGDVATDNIWDAKGDLAVGTGANTAAKQTVGSNDTVLTADSSLTNGVKWVKVGEGMLALTDVTTANVTSSAHGFAPKSPADSTKFLDGSATPAWDTVKDSDLSTSDITTNDVSTTKHGFTPKAPNDTSKFLRGDGSWASPGGGGGGSSSVATDVIWDAKGDLAAGTGADAASKLTVGTDYYALLAEAAQSTGLRWVPGASVLLYDYTVVGSDKSSIDTGVDTPDAGIAGTSAFPTNFRVLEVFMYVRTDESAIQSQINFIWNNDSGASNYDVVRVQDANTSLSGALSLSRANLFASVAGATATSGVFSPLTIRVPNYAGTVGYKSGDYDDGLVDPNSAANTLYQTWFWNYKSTSALSRLGFVTNTGGKKFKVGTRLMIFAR